MPSLTSPLPSQGTARFPSCASLRVGTDIVAVADVRASIARFGDRYLSRVYTPDELAYCQLSPDAPLHLAARFAAKEAILKVLRPAKDEAVDWLSIEVVRMPEGWCEVALRGAARALARKAQITGLEVSLSHESDYATAVVIAEQRERRAARAKRSTSEKREHASTRRT